jgi:hypothetical protein
VFGGDPHRARHVRTRGREAHGRRLTSVDARVPLVQRELERLGARPARAERGLEIGDERADVESGFDADSFVAVASSGSAATVGEAAVAAKPTDEGCVRSAP